MQSQPRPQPSPQEAGRLPWPFRIAPSGEGEFLYTCVSQFLDEGFLWKSLQLGQCQTAEGKLPTYFAAEGINLSVLKEKSGQCITMSIVDCLYDMS